MDCIKLVSMQTRSGVSSHDIG